MKVTSNNVFAQSDKQIEKMFFDLFEYGDLEQYVNYLDELCYEFVSNSEFNNPIKGEVVIFTSRVRKILVAANERFIKERDSDRLEGIENEKPTMKEGRA